MSDALSTTDSTDRPTRGRTLLDLKQQSDGTWVATQMGVDVEGTGETGALAAMDYCRKIAEGHHATDA